MNGWIARLWPDGLRVRQPVSRGRLPAFTADGIHLNARVRRWTAWVQYQAVDDPSRGYRIYGTSHIAVPAERGEAFPRDLSAAVDELLRLADHLEIHWDGPAVWSSRLEDDPVNLDRAAAEARRLGWPHVIDPKR